MNTLSLAGHIFATLASLTGFICVLIGIITDLDKVNGFGPQIIPLTAAMIFLALSSAFTIQAIKDLK